MATKIWDDTHNVNMWNINRVSSMSDPKGMIYRFLGRNGVMYEYTLPYGYNKTGLDIHEAATSVKSRARHDHYVQRGYDRARWRDKDSFIRKGSYQPIGDKRFFTFWQRRKLLSQSNGDATSLDFENYLRYLAGLSAELTDSTINKEE